jgi:phosphate transport system permease protein
MNAVTIDPREQKYAHDASGSTRGRLTLSLAAMAFGLFWLVWILVETVRLGVVGWCFPPSQMTPPPN